MRIVTRFYDQGDSGGAPVPVPGAVATAVPSSAPAVVMSPSAELSTAEKQDGAFRERTAKFIEKWRKESPTIEVPAILRSDAQNVAEKIAAPISEPVVVKPVEAPVVMTEVTKTPAPAPIVSPAEAKIFKFCGNDWTNEQVEDYIRYADKVSTRETEIAQKSEQIEALMKSPDLVILQELKNNDQLRAQVMELMTNEHPAATANLAAQEANAKVEALQRQLQTMDAHIRAREQQFVQSEQTRLQEVANQQAQSVVSRVKGHLDTQAKALGIPDHIASMIGPNVKTAVETGKVQFEPNALIQYVDGLLKVIVDDQNARANQFRNSYVQGKQQLPPPPPQGGAPSVGNAAPKDWGDARKRSQERIANALGGLAR